MDKHMKQYLLYLIFLGFACAGLQAESRSSTNNESPTHSNLSIDFMGKGGLTGFYYEHVLWENRLYSRVGFGTGIGLYSYIKYTTRNINYPGFIRNETGPNSSLERINEIFIVVPIYLNIQPSINVVKPLSEHVRFYIEPGTYVAQRMKKLAFMTMGIQINKKSGNNWGRMGIVIYFSPDQHKGNLWPSLALGFAF